MSNKFRAVFDSFFSKAYQWGDTPEAESFEDGIVSPMLPELELNMTDEELLSLAKKWEMNYNAYLKSTGIKANQDINYKYWTGDWDETTKKGPTDNIIFEATETVLPIITRENPEPTVYIENSQEGDELARTIRDMLADVADKEAMRIKLKDATRHWMLSYIGVVKIGWDGVEDRIAIRVVRPQKLLLDPEGTIVAGCFNGDYVGEIMTTEASRLATQFPEKKEEIKKAVKGEMGTSVAYTAWSTKEYSFYTMGKIVLKKMRNPNWNYDNEEVQIDEMGNEVTVPVKKNHFKTPQIPYAFLGGVFSTGKQPHDETCLIEQAIPQQDVVNKRQRQIDKNVDGMNNMIVFNQSVPQDKAQQAVKEMRKGNAISLPVDDIQKAVTRLPGIPLPSDVFGSVDDARNEIRNIFGSRGSTPQGTISEETVGGKVAVRSQDIDRLSFISDYLEQMADHAFNLMLQMMYVYYTEPQIASVVGEVNSRRYVELSNQQLFNNRVLVSVKEGSMMPKDSLTRRNEAIDLATAGLMDKQTLFERLEVPDPQKLAQRLWAEQSGQPEYAMPPDPMQQLPNQPI